MPKTQDGFNNLENHSGKSSNHALACSSVSASCCSGSSAWSTQQ
jgi:hypothetical protein